MMEAKRIHDARVASIAAANGYIRLEPGQVVVDREDARLVADGWFGTPPGYITENITKAATRIRAALAASGVEK